MNFLCFFRKVRWLEDRVVEQVKGYNLQVLYFLIPLKSAKSAHCFNFIV